MPTLGTQSCTFISSAANNRGYSTMPDFLEKQRRELEQRRDELKPLLEESERLQAALSALAGIPGSTQTATASPVPAPAKATTGRRRKPGRPRKSAASPA